MTTSQHFLHEPTPAALEAVNALRALPGGQHSVFAEAVHEGVLRGFVASRRLTPARGQACVYRLTGKPCPHQGFPQWPSPRREVLPHTLPGADHVSQWSRDRTPVVFVSQPYFLRMEDMRATFALCDQYGWTLRVSTRSWHFTGETFLVEIWKKGEGE
jgi:hypothetical protein